MKIRNVHQPMYVKLLNITKVNILDKWTINQTWYIRQNLNLINYALKYQICIIYHALQLLYWIRNVIISI